MHTLGTLCLGDTIVATSGHQLLVLEDWFNSLSKEEKKFIIAHRVVYLENLCDVKRSAFRHILLPQIYKFIFHRFSALPSAQRRVKNSFEIFGIKSYINFFILQRSLKLKISLDQQACKRVQSVKGAKEFLKNKINSLKFSFYHRFLEALKCKSPRFETTLRLCNITKYYKNNELKNSKEQC